MKKIFIENMQATDDAYNNIRDKEHLRVGKDFVEQLWKTYKHYAEPKFLKGIQEDFHARFWELYLACTLIENCFILRVNKGIGPDILIEDGSQKVWIEAIAPTCGDSEEDKVPEVKYNEVFDFPEEKIILRYTNAISTKCNDFKKNFEKGIVKEEDAYIIAVNGSKILYPENDPPLILKSVLPIGYLSILIDTKTMEVIDKAHTYRDSIMKANGAPIGTSFFMDSTYENISGILFSRATLINHPEKNGSDFIFIHNPFAKNKIRAGFFNFGKEYFVSLGEQTTEITCKEHN